MMTETKLKLLDQYNHALSLYKSRKWAEAKAEFQKALEIEPEDGPTKVYIQRCDEYLEHPPGEDWDGVFVMKTK